MTEETNSPANSAKASAQGSAQASEPPRAVGREWQVLENTLLAATQEQRRARRWGIFFKSLAFLYLFILLAGLSSQWMEGDVTPSGSGHTALIEVKGVISEDELASADTIVTGLRRAFENEHTAAVILRINSPGGRPVQAGYIYDEIMRLKGLHPDIKVYAVIADLGASGGYYIAAAADEIYAHESSLVGSIGVTAATFGFVDTLDKLGIERRLYTAGENKAFLDPFSPSKPEQVVFWKTVLNATHQQFIDKVKEGRGDRLADDEKVFSGLIWSGEQALELGLIDGLGSSSYVAREIVGQDNIVDFTPRRSPFEQFTDRLGVSVARTLATQLGMNPAALDFR